MGVTLVGRVLATLLFWLAWALPSPAAEPAGEPDAPPAEHVVLVSIDALRPEFYLDAGWPAPMLQQMAREGAHARAAVGVYPTVTYPSHTTILTGVLPAAHGIHYNTPFEATGATGRWYWEEERIRVPTLWDAVRAAGLTSASLGWPASVGAPVDWNLPEIWSLGADETAIDAMRRHSSPPELWAEIEREATGRLTMENFDIAWLTRDDRAGDIAAYLLATRRPALLTVHLIETDHFQHEEGTDSPRVRRAVATADTALSQMVEAAKRLDLLERTAFVVVGDHGMVDVHNRLAPNVWLADAGLRGRDELGPNWRATFHTASASAFLHLADPADRSAIRAVRSVLDGLDGEIRSHFRVLERDELDRLGAAPDAALGLALAPGVDATPSALPPAVRPRHGGAHGYLPSDDRMKTGFVAWGAGIRPSTALEEIRLTEVAPLVARLLGVELPSAVAAVPADLLRVDGETARYERRNK